MEGMIPSNNTMHLIIRTIQEKRMTQMSASKPWSVEQRLEFIDFMACWEGGVNRSDIVGHFGVSPQQASSDLATYQELAPDNLRYDLSAKRYLSTSGFTCRFIAPDADSYLRELTAITTKTSPRERSWVAGTLEAAVIPMPARRVDPQILRQVLSAIRAKHSLEIKYLSLNSEAPVADWRRITPHAFASDGFRWHMRAFCHRDARFKDFLLSRCSGARNEAEASQDHREDWQWHNYFDAIIISNPDLSPGQREAIEHDYGMTDGQCILPIRYALLYYFDKRLGADFAPSRLKTQLGRTRETPILISNLDDYEAALLEVGVHTRPATD